MMKSILRLMVVLCVWFALEGLVHAFVTFGVVSSEPLPPGITCTAPLLTGLPQFTQTPPHAASYPFGGTCTSAQVPKALITYHIQGTWTPTAPANQPNASEIFTFTGYEPIYPGRGPGGQIIMVHTAKCVQDPWITSNRNCSLYGASIPDDIRESWSQVDTIMQLFPWTGDVIPPADRSQLLAQYNKINGIVTTPPINTGTAGIRQQTAISQFVAPSILSPTAGQHLYAQMAIPIKLAPPKGWHVTSYMVDIQRQDASGNWVVQTNIPIAAAQAQSAQGYTEFGAGGSGPTKYPQSLTSPGAWRLNAEVYSPTQSGWSDWVDFTVITSPFTSPARQGILKR